MKLEFKGVTVEIQKKGYGWIGTCSKCGMVTPKLTRIGENAIKTEDEEALRKWIEGHVEIFEHTHR